MERSASDKTAQIIIPPGSDVEIQSNSIEDHELHPIQFSIQLQAATTYIHYPTQANIFLGKKMRKKGSKSEKKKKPNKHADKVLFFINCYRKIANSEFFLSKKKELEHKKRRSRRL